MTTFPVNVPVKSIIAAPYCAAFNVTLAFVNATLPVACVALYTKAVVANCVVLTPDAEVGAAGVPVNVGDANNAPPTPVTSAASNVTAPVRVLNEVTPEAATAEATKAVVANWVVFVPAVAVGAVGVPVNAN